MGVKPKKQFLYARNLIDSTVQIYDITRPTDPVHKGQFGGLPELNHPIGLVIAP